MKLIIKSTFIVLVFFMLLISSPLAYASIGNTLQDNVTIPKDLNWILSAYNNNPQALNSITSLLTTTTTPQKTTSINNKVTVTPLITTTLSSTKITNKQDNTVQEDVIKNLQSTTITTPKTKILGVSTLIGILNSNRIPSFTYVPTRISVEEARQLYVLAFIFILVGAVMITNGWLYNISNTIHIATENFEFNQQVILDQ